MGYNIKYLFTAAIATFLTSNYVLSNEEKFLLTYESKTGLKYPQSVIDLACLANTFPSHFKQKQNENNICYSQVFKNYTEIKQIKNLLYDENDQSFISNTYPSIGIKGIHLKVFEKQKIDDDKNQYVFIVIRHQEYDSILTDEMNEMMSLFGEAATVDRKQGNKETFGSSIISSIIRFIRKQFSLDYLPQAISMFNKIQLYYKDKSDIKYIFSGFSAGGLYAIILALYFNYPAITFSSTGVEDIIQIYYSDLFINQSNQLNIPPIFNFAHELDPTIKLDCQLGTLCLFQNENFEKLNDKELELLHLNTIFGESEPYIIQWLQQTNKWICITADNYNLKYGSCKRERLRWKDRMKLNSIDEQINKQDL